MARFANFGRITDALGQGNYGLYIAGSSIGLIGLWIHRVAAGWLTWELTQSGAWLGLMAFADFFPSFVLTPFAGVLADRVNRHRLILITQVLQAVLAAILAAITVAGIVDIWSLLAITLLAGMVAAVNTAARLTFVPNLVPREHLGAAIAIDATHFNLARFIGPAFAGIIIDQFGVGTAFAINAATFTVFACVLTRVKMLAEETTARPAGNAIGQFVEGMRYALGHRGIAAMLVVLVAAALGIKPYMELLAGFAGDVFKGGPHELAIMTATTGIGAVIGAVWLGQRAGIAGLARITVWGLVIGGLSLAAFGSIDNFWLAVPMTVVAGFGMQVIGTGTQTMMQAAVAGPVRGRVMSLYGMIFRGGPAVGALIMGWLSEYFGLQAPVIGGGILCIMVALITVRRLATIRATLETLPK
ncbi:MAG: MFS transporter [Alphaproteobacteria bacterium]|nr:MFS transporter [Alphaproteobacteria bacterium]